jgi:hypothetical protein
MAVRVLGRALSKKRLLKIAPYFAADRESGPPLYSEGETPLNFLKALVKELRLLKPHSLAIASTLKFFQSPASSFCTQYCIRFCFIKSLLSGKKVTTGKIVVFSVWMRFYSCFEKVSPR